MTEDELAAVAAALLCHPERSEAKSRDNHSAWLAAARQEAILRAADFVGSSG